MTTAIPIFSRYFLLFLSVLFVACGEVKEPLEKENLTASEQGAREELVAQSSSQGDGIQDQKAALNQLMQIKAKQQAEGLGSGGVKVNRAWVYRGYSYLSPDPNAAIEARLVGVDVTVSGHTPHFDIDDIEIVDGASLQSYGSDPHATALTLEGAIMQEGEWPEEPPKASRWLLIYAYPKQSPAFHLYYWGKALTTAPVQIEDSGLELPFPPLESKE